MKTNLNHLKSTTYLAINLVHKNPRLILASMIVSLISLIGGITDLIALSLALSLILFSWSYVELDLLFQVKQNKKIIWSNLIKKIGHYLKKTWPLIAIGLIFFLLILPFFINLFVLKNAQGIHTAAANILSLPQFALIADIATTILSLWFVQSMVILVVDNQPVLRSLKMAVPYLLKHVWFLLIMTFIYSIIGLLTRTLIDISPFFVGTRIAYLLFSAYLGLIIKSILLTNYLK